MISIGLSEWSEVRPAGEPSLRGFRFTDPDARILADSLTHQRVLGLSAEENGLAVRSFSHVGRLELDGLTVTVRPKLGSGALLELFRYAYSLRDLRLLEEAGFQPGAQGFQDLLVAQLHAEARELIQRGMTRRYVRRTEDLASPRGRLEISRMARRMDPSAATVPCTYHPRSSDFLLNQIVLAGLELARGLAVAPTLRRGIGHCATLLGEVASRVALSSTLLRSARRSLDRLSRPYEPVLRLIELLYQSSSLVLDEGTISVRLKGFLFDMNRFFQALVSKFLRESLPDCRVEDEVSLRRMMAYAPGFNPRRRRSPRPRPDFVVTRGGGQFILDAKYRDLWHTELPRDMLYQLAIYAMSQPRGATAAILYPTDDLAATEAIIDVTEPTSGAVRAHVALRPVVIPLLVELLNSPARFRERQRLARTLAFGEGNQELQWSTAISA